MIKLFPWAASISYLDKSKGVAHVIHLTKHLDVNERQSKLEVPELLLAQAIHLLTRSVLRNKD